MKNTTDAAFDAMQKSVVEHIKGQEGLLGMDRCRNADGLGFSISYWDSLESIEKWKNQTTHAKAQHGAREKWYSEYVIRTCKVEYDSCFSNAPIDVL